MRPQPSKTILSRGLTLMNADKTSVFDRRLLVFIIGKLCALLLLAALVPLRAADINVTQVLKGVEDRYNHIQTLEISFGEINTLQGRKRSERGDLFLRKPGKMRWQYTQPAGKLFVSDGKFIYAYYPDDNRAEKMKLKETDDMRAPLAFLLGRLNFKEDFRSFAATPDRDNVFITAQAKSDNMPYTEVTFLISPDSVIHYIKVKNQDGSLLEYTFENEKRNPPIPESMFSFVPPPGVEFTELK
jgi:outer membrane lipoprotein carrier protein